MLQTFFILLAIAIVFDGIKILIETLGSYNIREGRNDKEKVTAVISVYNNPDILKTISSIAPYFEEIIVINDGSDDNTPHEIKVAVDFNTKEEISDGVFLYTGEIFDAKIKLIDRVDNYGKVYSIHQGLEFVDTEYVFIADDDIKFSDGFVLPTSLLGEDADAVSFFVVPEENKSWWYGIQLHEYVKSMQIGRRFADSSKSVECVSGCAGLFKTERILKLSKEHSQEWQGEDLERTLLELIDGGRVRYSEQLIYTDVPKTFLELSKQRIKAWWGGLYRNIPKFFKITKTRSQALRIRFETLYNIISLILDPLKLISFWGLVIFLQYEVLIALYLVYALFEFFIYLRYKNRTPIKPKWRHILMYPFYGLLQMHYRILAGIYMLYIKSKRTLGLLVILILSLSSMAIAQDKDDFTVGLYQSTYTLNKVDNVTNDFEMNYSAYVGYKDVYANVNYGLYDQINVGLYYNKFLFDVGLRKETVTPSVLYTHWFGNHIVRGGAKYNYNYGSIDKSIYPNNTSLRLGYGKYSPDFQFYVDVIQELERYKATTVVAKADKNLSDKFKVFAVGSYNTEYDYVASGGFEYGGFHLSYARYSQFDFTDYNMDMVTVGYKFTF